MSSPLITKQGGATVPIDATEQQDLPLGPWEATLLYGSIFVCGVATMAVIAGTVGYLYFKHWA